MTSSALCDQAAEATAISVLQLLQTPLTTEERQRVFQAIVTVVRAGLHVSLELYRLRLREPSLN